MTRSVAPFSIVLLALPVLAAGPDIVVAPDTSAGGYVDSRISSSANPPYRYPTAGQRLHQFVHDTLSPEAALNAAFGAGIKQAYGTPPEWGGGIDGYGSRIADSWGRIFISSAIEQTTGALLGEDTRYFRCDCSGVLPRTKHALISTFIARTPSGGKTIAFARLAGDYGSSMIGTYWYPARFDPLKDGFRSGNYAVLGDAGWNLTHEFWPDVKRKLFHKSSD